MDMKKEINLYYYNPVKTEQERWGIKYNAGDYYGRYVLEKLGYTVNLTDNPELITCGSILGSKEWNGNPIVWGSGFHNEHDFLKVDIENIFAVRGKLTYEKLNTDKEMALGDPGLLASYFYKPKTKKKYDFGFVTHYVDYNDIKNKFPNIHVISMTTNDIEGLFDKINECRFIFSSSLHGLIFAHSLGIPAIHVENKPLYSKNNFKFKDYYSVFKSIKYIKETVDTVDFNKYINNNSFKPTQKEISEIQKNLLRFFPYGKIAICAVAKCENNYINDWVNYHLNLGVDEIHIYDNNDPEYEDVLKRIDNKEKVFVHKIPNAKEFQIPTYNKFYKDNGKRFDWVGFLDIDEYIILNKWKSIKDFLNDDKFKWYNVIKLNWHMFGDDDKVKRDMSLPIYKGITKRLKGHEFESHGKQFIRGHQNEVEICSNHYCLIHGRLPKQIMPDCRPTEAKISGHHNCEEAYINHYMTKTLSEFIDQKLARGTDASFKNRKINFDYFWRINTKTTDKLNFIEKYYECMHRNN